MFRRNICLGLIAINLFYISASTSRPNQTPTEISLNSTENLYNTLCRKTNNKLYNYQDITNKSESIESSEKFTLSPYSPEINNNSTDSLLPYQIELAKYLCSILDQKQQKSHHHQSSKWSELSLPKNSEALPTYLDNLLQLTDYEEDINVFSDELYDDQSLKNTNNSSSKGLDLLPKNCSFWGDTEYKKEVVCAGRKMISAPIFRNLRHLDTLIFNSTGIQVLDVKSIEGLPFVKNLIFTNGVLMRVAFKELLTHQHDMINLSLVSNSILSITFSNFYVEPPRKDVLRILDLRNNLITNLVSI